MKSDSPWPFIWKQVKKQKIWLIWAALFAAANAVAQVLLSDWVKNVQDRGLSGSNMQVVYYYSALLVALLFMDAITDFLNRICMRIGTERLVRNVRNLVSRVFLTFSESSLSRYSTGTAVAHTISDTQALGQGIVYSADIVRQPFLVVGLFAYLIYLNPWLTLLCCVLIPIQGLMGRGLGRSARRNQGRIQQGIEKISNHIIETVKGIRTAHVFGQTSRLKEEFENKNESLYGFLIRLARTEELVSPLSKWISSFMGAALVAAGGYLVVQQEMSSSSIVAYIFTAARIIMPIRILTQVHLRLQTVAASAERLQKVFQEPLDAVGQAQRELIEHSQPALPAPEKNVVLTFEGVSFRYPAPEGAAQRALSIQNISLQLPAQKTLALVGPSGSGKTTLSLLAMRLLDPLGGRILLGAKDARSWPLAEYRNHFSYVGQDVFLFDRSLKDNLLFANPRAEESEIWQALEQAAVAELVRSWPERLETILGEGGSRLSGGEKQRIAIARAFLRDRPILILDEATSHLDSKNEDLISRSLEDLKKSRSVMVIAHRLSTVRSAHEVVVLREGRVVEQGPPQELLQKAQGLFSDLWRAQGLRT